MLTFWRIRAGRLLVLAALLSGAAAPVLAHHPERLHVSEPAVLTTAEGTFLQLRVDLAPGEPLRLSSVVVDGEGAVLEHRDAQGYRPVSSVIIGAGVQRFGADTLYRIRLHDAVLSGRGYGDRISLSALFEPGHLVSQEIRVGTLPLPWLLVGLAAVVALGLWPLLRRSGRLSRAPEAES